MGRGTIIGGDDAGRFTVSLDYGSSVIEERIDSLEAKIDLVEQKITAEELFISSKKAEIASLEDALDSAIIALKVSENGEEERKAVAAATLALSQKIEAIRPSEIALSILQSDLANLRSDLLYAQSLDLTETRSLWCVDYTTNAEGLAATIEIDGEPPKIVIAPGCRAPESSDGELIARGAMSAAQVYLNAALLPGWQKWLPTFRSGYITALDRENDLADVTLDSALSSAQNLDINQAVQLSAVPIEYMNCNSGAFAVGDDVVVQFEGQDWGSPKVIGFVREPKPCAPQELAFCIEELFGSQRTINPDSPTYTAMYSGIAGDPTSVTGLNSTFSTPYNLPSPGWATYQPKDPNTIQGGSYSQNDAVLRFDLALQKVSGESVFNVGSSAGTIIRNIEVEEYGNSLVLPGQSNGVIESPGNAAIAYVVDGRTSTTVQNGDDEDITFAVGTITLGRNFAYFRSGDVDLFQDPGTYDAIFSSYFTAPASIVAIFNEKRFLYTLKYAGPTPALANPDTFFSYIPTGSATFTSAAYKRWLWATYQIQGALPDVP